VFVSNHPTGTLDGLVLIHLLSKVRPDVKFMGNMLLSRLEPLKEFFIEVNPFDSHSAQNVGGIRASMEHVRKGGALVIFPAGEISTYKHPFFPAKNESKRPISASKSMILYYITKQKF
jgi:putative hemolysin